MRFDQIFICLFAIVRMIYGVSSLSGKINQLFSLQLKSTALSAPFVELQKLKRHECAFACYKHILCQSFDYNESENLCSLHDKTVNTVGVELYHNTTADHYENYVAMTFGETCNSQNKCNAPNGKCLLRKDSFLCACDMGYSGEFCEIRDDCYFQRPSAGDVAGYLLYEAFRNVAKISTTVLGTEESQHTNDLKIQYRSLCVSLCEGDTACKSCELTWNQSPTSFDVDSNPLTYRTKYNCRLYGLAMPRTNNTRLAWDEKSYLKLNDGMMIPYPYSGVRPAYFKRLTACSIEECTAKCKNTNECIAATMKTGSTNCDLYYDIVLGAAQPSTGSRVVVIDSHTDLQLGIGKPMNCTSETCNI